jgi:3-hydroxyisobutyrate dehydrogenase-like beta-hydroxyacid dehydrogenase
LNIIMETARAYHAVLPAAALAHQLFNALLAAERGELDHSAVITVIEDLSRCQARTHADGKSEAQI